MFPFRLGTTSYIIQAGIVENARFLAGKVQDIELVIFDLDDGQNNVPDSGTIHALEALAQEQGLTYTVHLPEDLHPGGGAGQEHASLAKARRLIERTKPLQPWAYIAHLDGREVRAGASRRALQRWQDGVLRVLEKAAEWAGGPELLAVENLEGYPLDFTRPVVERIPVSLCVDVGHLWLDGHDPLPYLEARLPRIRVIHLHGGDRNGHQSLNRISSEKLAAVLRSLERSHYRGVVTLEVFGEEDFFSSLEALSAADLPAFFAIE